MASPSGHPVCVEIAASRAIAAVQARLRLADVPQRFAAYLDEVYAASRAGAVQVDGQNIFVYRPAIGRCTGTGATARRACERTASISWAPELGVGPAAACRPWASARSWALRPVRPSPSR